VHSPTCALSITASGAPAVTFAPMSTLSERTTPGARALTSARRVASYAIVAIASSRAPPGRSSAFTVAMPACAAASFVLKRTFVPCGGAPSLPVTSAAGLPARSG
jgi:hypothetical protein